MNASPGDDPGPERVCYRYRTRALAGPWRRERERALQDAVAAAQVDRLAGGEVRWRVPGELEESRCDKGGACGGVFPPQD